MVLLMLASVLNIKAEEGVILSLKNGSEVAFAFTTKPRLAMGEVFTISASDGTNVIYSYSDVKSFRFGEFSVTAIETLRGTEDTAGVTFRISGGQLQVFALPQGESVSVYDLDGRRVAMQKQMTDGGVLNIPLNANGVLVVRTSTGISYRVVIP